MLYVVMLVSSETTGFGRSPINHVKQCLYCYVRVINTYFIQWKLKNLYPLTQKGTSPDVSYGVHYISLLVILTDSKRKEQLPCRT